MAALKRLWDRIKFLVLKYPNRAQVVVQSALAVATAFGLGWNGIQVGAVMTLTAGLLALFSEQNVTPLVDPSLPANTSVTVVTPDPQVADKTVVVR